MKNTIIAVLVFFISVTKISAQGYLGAKGYVTLELLHPIIGNTNLQINRGFLHDRFYAFDWQLNFFSQRINLYSRYNLNLPNGLSIPSEYLAAATRLNGIGTRLTLRNFNKASYKAAPIGWYINYSAGFIASRINCTIKTKTTNGFDNSTGVFVINTTTSDFKPFLFFPSLIFTTGKTFIIYPSCYLDFGIDFGIRLYFVNDLDWETQGNKIYTTEYFFANRINKNYLYKKSSAYFQNGYYEYIYEPVLKIGYMF